MTGRFRSWVEDYVQRPQEMPIDLEAFRMRANQRGRTSRLLSGQVARAIKPGRHLRQRYEQSMSDNMQAEVADREHRANDPIERGRLHLQRRGLVVVSAPVVGGPPGHWKVSGQRELLTSAQLMALARAKGFRL